MINPNLEQFPVSLFYQIDSLDLIIGDLVTLPPMNLGIYLGSQDEKLTFLFSLSHSQSRAQLQTHDFMQSDGVLVTRTDYDIVGPIQWG